MPKIRYIGPFDAVVLPTLGIETRPGEVIDVDDESFANLVEQHDWEAAKAAKADKSGDSQ